MKRKIVFLISVFVISLCVNFRDVNALNYQAYMQNLTPSNITSSSGNSLSVSQGYVTNGVNDRVDSFFNSYSYSRIVRFRWELTTPEVITPSQDYGFYFYAYSFPASSSFPSGTEDLDGSVSAARMSLYISLYDQQSGARSVCNAESTSVSGGLFYVTCSINSNQNQFTRVEIYVESNNAPQLSNSYETYISLSRDWFYSTEDKAETIIEQQQQTNEKLDDINQSQEETNEKLDDLNESITSTDVSGAQSDANNFFSGFEDDSHGLTAIVTAPLNLIQSITSSTCTPLGFEAPFVDQQITLPCMKEVYEEHFGSFLTLYQTITFGVVAYWVCVNILATVRGFKDPDSDKIEVLDL